MVLWMPERPSGELRLIAGLFSPGMETRTRGTVGEIARVFLKLGTTAFGGPAAHIAMVEREIVRRRAWLSHEEFLDRGESTCATVSYRRSGACCTA